MFMNLHNLQDSQRDYGIHFKYSFPHTFHRQKVIWNKTRVLYLSYQRRSSRLSDASLQREWHATSTLSSPRKSAVSEIASASFPLEGGKGVGKADRILPSQVGKVWKDWNLRWTDTVFATGNASYESCSVSLGNRTTSHCKKGLNYYGSVELNMQAEVTSFRSSCPVVDIF